MTLYGRNLSGVTAVTFGAQAATNVVFASGDDSYGSITATAPSGTGGVQVTATTPGGTSNGVSYTYFPAPHLMSVVPAVGDGGRTQWSSTARTSRFATAVYFGAASASFTVDSDTQISAIVPAGPSDLVQVTVISPGGTSEIRDFYYRQ